MHAHLPTKRNVGWLLLRWLLERNGFVLSDPQSFAEKRKAAREGVDFVVTASDYRFFIGKRCLASCQTIALPFRSTGAAEVQHPLSSCEAEGVLSQLLSETGAENSRRGVPQSHHNKSVKDLTPGLQARARGRGKVVDGASSSPERQGPHSAEPLDSRAELSSLRSEKLAYCTGPKEDRTLQAHNSGQPDLGGIE